MFSYNHLYEEMIEYDVVAQAAADASQGKLDRSDVMEAILHFDKSYQYCIVPGIFTGDFSAYGCNA